MRIFRAPSAGRVWPVAPFHAFGILGSVPRSTCSLAQDFAIAGATLTHKKRDGSTTQGTQSITATPGADPVTGLA